MTKGPRSRSWNHAAGRLQAGAAQETRKIAAFSTGLLPLAAGLSFAFAPQALAQTASDNSGELQEIVVTAEKRSTSLQKTPMAVTALNGEQLRQRQVDSLADINSLVPGFRMGEVGGFPQIAIRGISNSNFVAQAVGTVAVNLNEVYVSRPIAQKAGLFDVSAIEVLRGPQGTLYGRNATAGAVNITTTRPTNDFSGFVRGAVGNYGLVHVEGAVGRPIVEDKLLVRVAGFRKTRNGYGKNVITGTDIDDHDAYGIRGTLVITPTSHFKATLIGEYEKEDDRGAQTHYLGALGLTGLPGAIGLPPLFVRLGGIVPSDPRDVASGIDPIFRLETEAVTGILEWNDGPVSLKSITGYRNQDSLTRKDISSGQFLGATVIAGEPAHQFSQEIQAHYDTSRIHITGGLFYFKEHNDYTPAVVVVSNQTLAFAFPFLPPAAAPTHFPGPGLTSFVNIGGLLKTTAKAAFAEGTFSVTDKLSVTAGIRYSTERRHLFQRNSSSPPFRPYTGDNTPPPAVSIPPKTFNAWTPKFGIQYQVTPATLLYATYAKGFKAGGFDAGTAPAFVGLGFAPEKLTDYEGGIKTTLFDRRLRLALSGFYYDYTDLQVQQPSGVAQLITTNAGRARAYGAEAEFTALVTDAFTIEGNAAWLHARYTEYLGPDPALPGPNPLVPLIFDFEGNRLNNAPDFTAFLAASYRWDLSSGNLVVRGEGNYSSKYFFSPGNIPLLGQSAYAKANAFVTYTSNDGWHATAFVRNITDKTTVAFAAPASALLGSPAQGGYDPPRTYGVELGYRF